MLQAHPRVLPAEAAELHCLLPRPPRPSGACQDAMTCLTSSACDAELASSRVYRSCGHAWTLLACLIWVRTARQLMLHFLDISRLNFYSENKIILYALRRRTFTQCISVVFVKTCLCHLRRLSSVIIMICLIENIGMSGRANCPPQVTLPLDPCCLCRPGCYRCSSTIPLLTAMQLHHPSHH